jgi:GTP cyclohydrolase IA
MTDGTTQARVLRWSDVESWAEVAIRPDGAMGGGAVRVWGVPRGGVHIAQALRAASARVWLVGNPADATHIVDDLVDSGRTRDRFESLFPDARFIAMVDKTQIEDPVERARWVAFPWEMAEDEYGAETPASDNALRLLQSLGVPLDAEGTAETPERLVKSLRELTQGYGDDPARILSKRFPVEKADEMIVVRGIGFWSLCEHHVLPFHGTVDVGYIPGESVVGLSKIARLVHCFARRLQIQERLTQQVAHALQDHLGSAGVGVVVRATHLCMAMRGVRSPAEMVRDQGGVPRADGGALGGGGVGPARDLRYRWRAGGAERLRGPPGPPFVDV